MGRPWWGGAVLCTTEKNVGVCVFSCQKHSTVDCKTHRLGGTSLTSSRSSSFILDHDDDSHLSTRNMHFHAHDWPHTTLLDLTQI